MIRGILLLLLVAVISSPAAIAFIRQWQPDVIVKGPGVARVGKLSEYFAGIKGTANDPDYYLFEGSEPGGTMIVWGGTHPVEPAASLGGIAGAHGGLDGTGIEVGLKAIRRNGIPLLEEGGSSTLTADVRKRLALFDQAVAGRRPAAFINVGGSLTSVGDGPASEPWPRRREPCRS